MKNILIVLLTFAICFPQVSSGQKPKKSFTITGRVTDEAGKPVPGGTIFIDQVKTTSVTNENGEYRVKVNAQAKEILVFTLLLGASKQEINGRSAIDFAMGKAGPGDVQPAVKADTRTAPENIPSGTINARDPKFANSQTIYDLIRGQVPGVEVSGTSIRIRGERSLHVSNEPIFVVDGVIVNSIEGISPQIVKSIKVLKGPDASVYGTRGANGVIEITLVSGKDR